MYAGAFGNRGRVSCKKGREDHHPWIAVTHLARLTFRFELSRIQGCFSRSRGYGLSLADRMRLIKGYRKVSLNRDCIIPDRDPPLSQKVLRSVGPHDLLLGRIDQPGHRLGDDEIQQLDWST
jgi:hypothetical protein